MQSNLLFRILATASACLGLSAMFVASADAAQVNTAPVPVTSPKTDTPRLLENEYELLIYRLPSNAELSKKICAKTSRCEKKVKGAYSFYAVSANANELTSDLSRMNLTVDQQYVVSANYELTNGKYFSVAFSKNGALGAGMLFEEISFVVKPTLIKPGKIDLDVFGLFQYDVFAGGKSVPLSDRKIAFKTSIGGTKYFFLIAEADAAKKEPVYLAVIKQCPDILYPSEDLRILEKGL